MPEVVFYALGGRSVEQKRAQHWSQTPEGRKRMSRIMKRRHREALRD